MAFTDYYVSADATGGGAGTIGDPYTLTEGLAAGGPSVRVWVKGGDYGSIAGGSMVPGDSTGFSILIGYNSTIGDLNTPNKTTYEVKDTTGFPVIALTSEIAPAGYCVIANLDLSCSLTTAPIYTTVSDGVVVYNCALKNTGLGYGLRLDDGAKVLYNDIVCSNTSHLQVFDADSNIAFIGNRVSAVNGVVMCEIQGGVVEDSFFLGPSDAVGVYLKLATFFYLVKNNSFQGLGEHIRLVNGSMSITPTLINNMATDATTAYINSLYAITANNITVEVGNRLRDNTADRVGIGENFVTGEVTTDTGGPETDYTDYANGDLTLIDSSPGVDAGLGFGRWNIGAEQDARTEVTTLGGIINGDMTGGLSS